MVSGSLVSLPENFLDSFIYREIDGLPETFTIAKLVGNTMGESEIMVGDRTLFERVMHIIEKGDLIIVEECKKKTKATHVKKNK